MTKILVIGDIGLDKYTIGDVRRISPEAPVPVLNVKEEKCVLGLAGNVAANLKSLGVDVTLVSVVGIDDASDRIDFELKLAKINPELVVDETRITTTKERITTSSQQICRVDKESTHLLSVDIEQDLMDTILDMLPNYDGVILQDYSKGVLTPYILVQTIEKCKELGISVAVDPGKKTNPRLYENADMIKPNLQEADDIIEKLGYSLSRRTWQNVAETISIDLNIPNVVITMGAEGLGVYNRNGFSGYYLATNSRALDVSGAGDTVIAVLMKTYLEGHDIDYAAKLANRAAGIVVGKKGTATVTEKELNEK